MTLIALDGTDFESLFAELQHRLLQEDPINVGEWQSQKIGDNPMQHMRELRNVSFQMALSPDRERLAEEVGAHLPWAEDHFQERTSGTPMNPAPSEEWWPFAQKVNRAHKSEDGGKFSHTYPERIWPKHAGGGRFAHYGDENLANFASPHMGIRFEYGDLDDLVTLLAKSPNTRQAYLPIWFPEDTGAAHGKRVPCTLGYHFQIRNGLLDITYYLRSCDLIRHFQDDVYMAGRLAQYVAHRLNNEHFGGDAPVSDRTIRPNMLYMHIANLHVFEGDTAMMQYRDSKGLSWRIA